MPAGTSLGKGVATKEGFLALFSLSQGVDIMGRFLDWQDRQFELLFADAGTVLARVIFALHFFKALLLSVEETETAVGGLVLLHLFSDQVGIHFFYI